MDSMEQRVVKLEGQINAMAQAWLYLATSVEMECGLDLVSMEECMRAKFWPGVPEIDREGRRTLAWLCDQLDEASANRARWSGELARISRQRRA